MRTSVLLTAAGLVMPVFAAAQQATTTPLTGNMALVSEYRLRGIDQTFGKPALQGGFDYSHPSGIYLGNWNSNVNAGAGHAGSNLEMDFYGGYKRALGDFELDAGFIYYYYPGSDAGTSSSPRLVNNRTGETRSGEVNNKEAYFGGSWKFLSLKYFHSLGDYFSVPGTQSSSYLDFMANFDAGRGWGLNAHVGRFNAKGIDDRSYSDWKLGVTKDLSGWILSASYIGTNAKGDCSTSQPYCFTNGNGPGSAARDAGRSTIVASITKAF